MIATPANAAIAINGAQSRRLRNNGAAIFATTAISRPTAAVSNARENAAEHFDIAEPRIQKMRAP